MTENTKSSEDQTKKSEVEPIASAGSGDGDKKPPKPSDVNLQPEPARKKKRSINLEKVRSRGDQFVTLGIATEFTKIPIRKPSSEEFFRCHPSPEMQIPLNILELKSLGEWYLVNEDLLPDVPATKALKSMQLYVCCTTASTPFVHLIPLPNELGKMNDWHESGHETMVHAQER